MTTSKRKFNALLLGLGSKQAAPNDSKQSNDVPGELGALPKRLRISRPTSLLGTSATNGTWSTITKQSSSHSARTDLVLSKTTPSSQPATQSAATHTSSDPPPTYAPWDRDAFLNRLKTFSVLKNWNSKPDEVNEAEWAKRGWACVGEERVRCCSCNKEIVVKLNSRVVDGEEVQVTVGAWIEQALVDKYVELIVSSHAQDCLWRNRGCRDDIIRVPFQNATHVLQGVQERFDSLMQVSEKLPYLHNIDTPQNFDLEQVLDYMPKDAFSVAGPQGDDAVAAEARKVALILAIFGWSARYPLDRVGGSAQCATCFRTLGFWLFKSKEDRCAGKEYVPGASPNLDANESHRLYCPWLSRTVLRGTDKFDPPDPPAQLATWEINIQTLKNEAYLRERLSKDRAPKGNTQDGPAQDLKNLESRYLEGELADDDALSVREEKDNERWARLRKVKNLLSTRSSRKYPSTAAQS